MKRLIAIGDLHCGHYGGLTPPRYQVSNERRPKLHKLQVEGWNKFSNMAIKAIDTDSEIILLVNGDAIDGNMHPNEMIVCDRREQCHMAEECISKFNPAQLIMTRGTPVHVGKEEDWEDTIARELGGDIRSEQFINIEGYRVYARHKIGRSNIPHGKNTSLSRKKIWNELKAAWKLEPHADLLLFSHVHYCEGNFSFFGERKVSSMTLPALQTVSQYGIKECEGIVHFGLVYFDIEDGKLVKQTELIEIVDSACPTEIVIT